MTVGEWLESHSWVDSSLILIKNNNNEEKESKMGNFPELPGFQK